MSYNYITLIDYNTGLFDISIILNILRFNYHKKIFYDKYQVLCLLKTIKTKYILTKFQYQQIFYLITFFEILVKCKDLLTLGEFIIKHKSKYHLHHPDIFLDIWNYIYMNNSEYIYINNSILRILQKNEIFDHRYKILNIFKNKKLSFLTFLKKKNINYTITKIGPNPQINMRLIDFQKVTILKSKDMYNYYIKYFQQCHSEYKMYLDLQLLTDNSLSYVTMDYKFLNIH